MTTEKRADKIVYGETLHCTRRYLWRVCITLACIVVHAVVAFSVSYPAISSLQLIIFISLFVHPSRALQQNKFSKYIGRHAFLLRAVAQQKGTADVLS